MLCFVPVLRGCVCCYVRKNALLQCLCLCLCRVLGWDIVSQLPCILGVLCLVCQDPVSCYIYFVLLPLGPELW